MASTPKLKVDFILKNAGDSLPATEREVLNLSNGKGSRRRWNKKRKKRHEIQISRCSKGKKCSKLSLNDS